jgi:ADP-ribose pyrophosphatase YjhB (NUDIX family)
MPHFQTFHTTTKALLIYKNKLLALASGQGESSELSLPGGRIDENEEMETTFGREMQEELGLDISRVPLSRFSHFETIILQPSEYDFNAHTGLVIVYFLLQIPDNFELQLTMESDEVRPAWIRKNDDVSQLFLVKKIYNVVQKVQTSIIQ